MINPVDQNQDTTAPKTNNKDLSGKKILIVEDEEALAMALQLKLSSKGIAVKIAGNGLEGLEAINKEHFDLVLMDLIMPVMDGFTVLQKLKEQGNKIKIIILSNLSQQEDLTKAKDLGAIDFLIKSDMQLSKIMEYIEKVLAAS